MKRFLYELAESWKIAVAQMRSNMTRSTLTALGVIIGIVAVTLMGTAIGGIQVGFDKSMAIFGDDVLYVGQWPWKNVDDWWNYRDRKKIKTEYADGVNRMIAMTPNSNLAIAIPTSSVYRSVKYMDSEVGNVLIRGTVSDYIITSTFDFKEGRFFNELESRGGANVCVIGYDVADALFPSTSPIAKSVLINGQPFKVVGVISRQGSFLGLFSLDSIVVMPLPAFQKYFTAKSEAEILVKVKDKTKLADAKDELAGVMRRVRGLPPEKKDDFSINEQQALKSTLDPIKNSIAIAGLFITGLSLFVGAIGIMNITFVSVKGAHKGNRNAQSTRRTAANDPAAIPDRVDSALSARRIYWARLCLFNVLRHRQSFPFVSDSFLNRPRACKHDCFNNDGFVLGLRAGLDSLTSRSRDGAAI